MSASQENNIVRIAYSPDSDDAFMMWALRERLIPWEGFEFEFHRDDIHRLNQEASRKTFDITAISIAHYPAIAHDFLLLPVGSSIGDDYGPAVVTGAGSGIKDIDDTRGRVWAVPGKTTSAFIAAHTLIGGFEAVEYPFKDIIPAVAAGDADVGILIHEQQMDPKEADGIVKLADLGRLWRQRYHAPLPLGGNAISRDIPFEKRKRLTALLQASIIYALEHRSEAIEAALAESQAGINLEQAHRYIDQYVNAQTVRLDEATTAAVLEFVRTAATLQNRSLPIHRLQDVFAI